MINNLQTSERSKSFASTSFLVGVAAALLLAGSASAQNLISDGSFESPLVQASAPFEFDVFTPSDATLPGWSIVGTEIAVVSSSFAEYGVTFVAESGNQWMDLSGLGAPNLTNGIIQSVATTSGLQYQLSFYLGSAYTGSGPYLSPTLDLSLNGGPRVSYTNSNIVTNGLMNWQFFTTTFTATSATSSIAFYYGATGASVWAVGLDNVSMTVVPAPGALAAFAAVAAAGRRRRMR